MYSEITKILVIVVIASLFYGCASTRRRSEVPVSDSTGQNLLYEVGKNNIDNRSFVIQKFSVNYTFREESKKFTGNLKHDNLGNMLISIRVSGGIEVARILLNQDSIKINDRVNKIYSYGKTDDLLKKYHFTFSDFYLLFGDLPDIIRVKDIGLCKNGVTESVKRFYNGNSIGVKIDCFAQKVVEFTIDEGEGGSINKIIYENINITDKLKIAERISISYPGRDLSAEIEMKGIRQDSVLNMRFKPGSGYNYQLLK